MKGLSLMQLYSMYKDAQRDNMHELMHSISKQIKEREKLLTKQKVDF